MRTRFTPRFDYGRTRPWVRTVDGALAAAAGPDALELRERRAAAGRRFPARGRVYRRPGQRVGFVLTYHPSWEAPPPAIDAGGSASTDTGVVGRVVGPVDVSRRLGRGGRTLADHPEGADVRADWRHRRRTHDLAAGVPGRGSKLGLSLLLAAGQRAPSRRTDGRRVHRRGRQLEGLAAPCGRRQSGRPPDHVRPRRRAAARRVRAGLASGVQNSRPVRVGNAASGQRQLDVYGEVMDAMFRARKLGMPPAAHAWDVERQIIEWLESHWQEPDDGLWEVRGPRRNFVHSKVMAWVAVDRAIRSVEAWGLDAPLERFKQMRTDDP